MAAPATSRLGNEDGFSLPELLVAAMIGLIVAAGGMTFVTTMLKAQPRVTDRAAQIQQGRIMLERVSRELREGDTVENTTAAGLRVHTLAEGWVNYACTAAACTRTPEGGTPVVVVQGISDANVFCYAPWSGETGCSATTATDPSYVALRLVFPGEDGGEAVTLDDGIALRNRSV